MLETALTILFFGIFLTLTIVAAFIGDRIRKNMVNRMMVGVKEGRFKEFSTEPGARKIRVLALFAFVSIMGILTTIFLLMSQIFSYDMKWIILLLLLSFVTIICGLLLIKQFLDKLRK